MERTDKILYTVNAIYLIFLLLVLAVFGYTPTNDGDGYIEFAQVCINTGQIYPCLPLIQGKPFIWNIGSINLTVLSLLWFNSLYPLLILLCFLKALTSLFIGKIAKKLFSPKVAVIACILYILYPNNWGQSTTILSEIPMICFACIALYMAVSNDKYSWLFISGVLFGIANWFRPVAMVFIDTLILYYLLFANKNKTKRCLSLCSGYVSFILLAGTYSYLHTGFFLFQAESLWFNMAEATYEKSVAPQYGTDPYPKGTIRYIENMNQKTAVECNRIWKERSLEWLKEHPVQYLKKIPGRLLYMYYNDMDNIAAFSTDKEKSENNFVTLPYRNILKGDIGGLTSLQCLGLFNFVYYLLLIALAVAGGCILLKRREYQKAFIPLLITIGGSLSLVLAVHGETRFKAPFMPFVFMLAATAVYQIALNKRKSLPHPTTTLN